ncbi:immunity 70 family protein [Bacillus suaedaesalsae]|uniref:Immunity 70 family protein n=1 Tax=Bacillus suaedaesalsae TaxID=2810349 RepID=A0ABS2DD06_9BACI|nr:immunity 70 family protein [Bacillus suaedaesalsae]MBM6616332.1 immunity 70 family protein [Bacillus suaedaesalsae]
MVVGFQFDCFFYQVGHGDFLHSFFSTISYHLEPDGWGTSYPKLLNDLYYKELSCNDIPKAIEETEVIRKKLVDYLPSQVVWDIDNLNSKPPWGDNISSEITNLSNYFKTSDGRDLFELLHTALTAAYEDKFNLKISSL